MSQTTVSQSDANPFADPTIPTLEEVLDRIAADDRLTKAEKTARTSAIRTAGRAIGLPLSAIPAHPAFLRKKLASVVPARVGLRITSWRNAKSILNKALREQGLDVMPGRYLSPISDTWKPYWEALPQRPFRIALSRFIRFASTRGRGPDDIAEDDFADFDRALMQESLVKAPETVSRDTRRFWNEAGDLEVDWPALRVAVPDRRDRYIVPLSEFPPSLAEELNEYRNALCGDILDIDSPVKPIRPESADNKIVALHRIASAAVAGGMPPSDIPDLRTVVRPDVVKRALRYIRERNGKDKLKSFDTLLAHALSTARHWVRAPEEEIAQLNRIKRALDINTYEMSEATGRVLRDLNDPALLRRLILLPNEVFEEIARNKDRKRVDLIEAQVALAIAILICAPIRPKNLAALHLERHLLEIGAGRKRRRHIRIHGEEVKNGEDLEYPLPNRVAHLLNVYLEEIRPRLARTDNLYLFPGEMDGPKGASLLSNQIANLTESRLGVRMTAHKFRAVAGKIILDQNPTGQEIARQVLGHRDITTTATYYAPLQRDRAIDLYDKAIRATASGNGRHYR
ncbi:tyrosine-type recombinase/integrase [Aliiruegeria lutimaris]|uniref:Phage integrase family protein n=1 Tax=Aliiruegeria lutimaris TaxID=571298 RepID=A0A1G9DME7_9RHOB|nr:tyrosine-type recombinase/integrase [Aliiruegeria lutimaris]SDK65034.1 Phage integrase family protein [Aliiruegeria lutimaris]